MLALCAPLLADASTEPFGAEAACVEHVGDAYRLLAADGRIVRRSSKIITNLRSVSVPDSKVAILSWSEQPGDSPYYAIALDGRSFGPARRAAHLLKLRQGDVDPAVAAPSLPATIFRKHGRLYLVQFVVPPLECFRRELATLGAETLSFFPEQARIVRMPPEVVPRVAALPYVRWVGPYYTAYRLEEPIRDELTASSANGAARRYNIAVFDRVAGAVDIVANRIVQMGGVVDVAPTAGHVMQATLTPHQLLDVAGLDQVVFIDRWGKKRAHMNIVRQVGGADYIESMAGYTGTGVRGEVQDDGCLTTHPDFASRIIVRNGPVPLDDPNHGTSTFGIVFGDGSGYPNARGMLPDAVGVFSTFNFAGSRYSNLAQLVTPQYECLFQSDSWGTNLSVNGAYSTYASELDEAVFDLDLLILHSQGNTGTRSTSPEPWAKNIVSVGGVFHFNTATRTDDQWFHPVFGAASIGPASDGRIKPDLCQFYDQIRTTKNTGAYIGDFGGTSASCAIVAGHFGLFYQMWADGIFGNPVSSPNDPFAERPHSSTARAMLINTATPYDFSGTFDDLTRTHQGWGIPDLQRMYDFRDHMLVVDESDVLQLNETAQYARRISAGDPFFRATLVYTDYHGTTSSNLHRVNDLSLQVTGPDGSIYYGNNGLLVGNESTPGGVPNTIDTVENVWLTDPLPGVWTIRVSANELNEDGHVETVGVTDADFGLVVSGGQDCPLPLFAPGGQPEPLTYTCPDEGHDVILTADVGDYIDLQWYQDDVAIAGETGLTLSLTGVTTPDLGTYNLEAINTCGTVWSEPAEVAEPPPPTITQQPVSPGLYCEDEDAFLTVAASGVGPLSYQWYHDSAPIAGATQTTLSFLPLEANDAGLYFCRVTNLCDFVDSNTVGIAVQPPPVFIEQPQSVSAFVGDTVMLHVEADAGAPLSYQWRKLGVSGAVGSGDTLTIVNAQLTDVGDYYAIAFTTNPTCTANSDTATINLEFAPCDQDLDGDCDLRDMARFVACFGPDGATQPGCGGADQVGGDGNIDLADWEAFVTNVSGPR